MRRRQLLKPYEAAFVLVALGFVAHEIIGEVKWLDEQFHAPARIAGLTFGLPFAWAEALWFLLIVPLLVWGLVAIVGYASGHRRGIGTLLLAAATGAAPLIAVAHLAKATAKLSSWVTYLPFALRDPIGIETFHSLATGSMVSPAALVALPPIGGAVMATLAFMAWKSWQWTARLPREALVAGRAAVVVTMALFAGVLAVWTAGS